MFKPLTYWLHCYYWKFKSKPYNHRLKNSVNYWIIDQTRGILIHGNRMADIGYKLHGDSLVVVAW